MNAAGCAIESEPLEGPYKGNVSCYEVAELLTVKTVLTLYSMRLFSASCCSTALYSGCYMINVIVLYGGGH